MKISAMLLFYLLQYFPLLFVYPKRFAFSLFFYFYFSLSLFGIKSGRESSNRMVAALMGARVAGARGECR
ncbi:uncharacterized protein CCOS01_16123 [Colletotrichum costaricense]|uniref:Uncharacterized protein n=1 Tax=Colletotrichum costaricense TaxID=1209916 RepID=A0AAJ0DSU2_9PEZI|nr:uncharacterized protein CCOS01_16123 [Colletotrichum costaricense]KAK1508122.1 hypothetical protein CCOS01_16123 [Colletotrichum costaricense]